MASAILFSSLIGVIRGEWRGTGSRTKGLLAIGLVLLLASTVISGWSGKLAQERPVSATAAVVP